MEVKEIEGVRISEGDTLVVVLPHPMSDDTLKRFSEGARRYGINMVILPPGSKVYVRGEQPRVAVGTLEDPHRTVPVAD